MVKLPLLTLAIQSIAQNPSGKKGEIYPHKCHVISVIVRPHFFLVLPRCNQIYKNHIVN